MRIPMRHMNLLDLARGSALFRRVGFIAATGAVIAATAPAFANPSLEVTTKSPLPDATLTGTVMWEALTEGPTKSVDFYVDNVLTWTEKEPPFLYFADGKLDTTRLPDGTHVLKVIANGPKNGTATHEIRVTVRNAGSSGPPPPPPVAPPTVVTSAPANGSTLAGRVNWAATVGGGPVTAVDFAVDGVVRDTDAAGPYAYLAGAGLDTTTLSNGVHVLAVTARGTGGSATHSVTVSVSNTTTAPPTAPVNTAPPVVSGTPVVGSTLSLSTGTWTGTQPLAYAYSWQRCSPTCAVVSGATAATYAVGSVDVGATLKGTVTATNAAGSAQSTSAATAAVTATTPPPPPPPTAPLGSALPARMAQSSGAGGTWYVDAALGNDANPGSALAPWRTINKALATVPLSGSIIKVRPGTYASTGTSYALVFQRRANVADPITLKAETPGTVTIVNGNQSAWTLGAWIYGASGLRVEGLTFRITTSGRTNVGADGMLIENSDRIEITNCTFNEMATIGVMVRGGRVDGAVSEDVWLVGNTFRPSSSGVYGQATGLGWTTDQYYGSKGSHYVYAGQAGDSASQSLTSGSQRLVIGNNVFAGSTAGRAIELGPQARESYVVNNTFFGNHIADLIGWGTAARYAGGGVEFYSNTGGTSYATQRNAIRNNLFVDLNGHGAHGSGPSLTGNLVSNNLAFDLDNGKGNQGDANDDFEEVWGTSMLFAESGNLRADPLFVAPGGFDFRLQTGSPAIGRSDPAYTPAFDAAGRARDSAPDLGAYER